MASAIFFVNQKGEEVVTRHFRSDIPKSSIDEFCKKIIGLKSTGQIPPVVQIDGTSFMFIRHRKLFLVGATRANPNAALVFEYLFQKIQILQAYLGKKFGEETLRGDFTLVFELFDETMDYGYPQNTTIDVLKLYINQGNVKQVAATQGAASLTSQITGAIDWRREGIRYRNNEVYIDVQETVNLVVSSTGAILRSDISGKVKMKALLTGMPECKFGLNDKLIMEKEGGAAAVAAANNIASGVEIDDCKFHKCVRLSKFDAERTITFIPPDGEFILMEYRVNTVSQPFRLLPNIVEEGKTKLIVNLKINADFPEDQKAQTVIVKIPMPPTAASAKVNSATRGRARFEPGERALVWRISGFQGQSECNLDVVVDLLPNTREKAWVRPPIRVDFQIPMYAGSGVQVRFLKVYEKNSYQTSRWVKYFTKAGEYEMRI